MIKVEKISKQYGSKLAVDNISFEIKKGEVVGLLGRNGAGKSTIMSIITGILAPTKGAVYIDGCDISEDDISAKRLTGYLPELPPVYPTMTVREYLEFVYDLKKCDLPKTEHIKDVAEKTGVFNVYDRLIKNLSKGYKQRVGMAQALIGNPQLLILDEPTVGLDPQQIVEVRELVRSLAKEHTVLLSSHILAEIQNVCSRVIVINGGKVVADASPKGLADEYLGDRLLTLRVIGKESDIYKVLSQVPGVRKVRKLGQVEPESYDFSVESDEKTDIRKAVFRMLANAGFVILSMKENELKLEDIFLELTEK